MAVSVQIEIDIKGDYSWDEQEQIVHERYISEIKHRLTRSLEKGNFPDRIWLKINIHYLAERQLFIFHSSDKLQERIEAHIKGDAFFRKYFV